MTVDSGASSGRAYPASAYAPSGELWWQLQTWPGTRKPYGAERRIAAWLAFNRSPGQTFTTAELRAVLGEGDVPNNQEHFQRRLRELRKDGWEIPSVKYDRNLEIEQYRLDQIGWHPALDSARPKKSAVSAKVRRTVLERDQHRCWLCGLGAGEPNPDNAGRPTALTVGHVRAQAHGGSNDPENLRAECTICNETMRSDSYEPPTFDVVMSRVRGLDNRNQQLLHQWISDGNRHSTPAVSLFDVWRGMAPGEQKRVADALRSGLRR